MKPCRHVYKTHVDRGLSREHVAQIGVMDMDDRASVAPRAHLSQN